MTLKNETQHKVVVVGLPLVDSIHAPMAAPAVLKASLTQAGITSVALDLNIEILLKVKSHPACQCLKHWFAGGPAEDHVVEEIAKILYYAANRIIQYQPTVIALSLLTYECQTFTAWLCAVLRDIYPQAKIVIGGPGIKYTVANFDNTNFRDKVKKLGLIDDWIAGDGDQSLIAYVLGNHNYPGINNDAWQPVENLDALPYPDWSDYNFYLYSATFLPVVDAKGCVRNCEFCDIIEYWSKFQSRDADKLFAEMMHLGKKYNLWNFDFRSSISNGNLKQFKKLLQLMYDYNQSKQYDTEKIGWNASFIVRQKSLHPEEMFKQMGATGAHLSLGIESVIPHVRKNLGKNFANEDIDYHLEMAKKYNFKVVLEIITAYPTETVEDYEFTKQWFRDRIHYKDTISTINFNFAMILPGTQLHRNATTHGIIPIGKNHWQTKTITLEQRRQYHAELIDLCKDLGFNVR